MVGLKGEMPHGQGKKLRDRWALGFGLIGALVGMLGLAIGVLTFLDGHQAEKDAHQTEQRAREDSKGPPEISVSRMS